MLGTHDLWLFVFSSLLLNITPGPDTAYIVGRSVQFGWRGVGLWINRALGGLFVYLGIRIALFQR
jgi:threonine/homoserine/homoserine lactone efflux protein